jgi:DNA-binding NtrC family response regulator
VIEKPSMGSSHQSTFVDSTGSEERAPGLVPGVLVLWTAGRPSTQLAVLREGPLTFGRGADPGTILVDDDRVSREHVRIAWSGRRFSVTDLASRNGTALSGRPLQGEQPADAGDVVRIGQTLLLLADDVEPLRGGVTTTDDAVIGPAVRAVEQRLAQAARTGSTVLITGPSGAGKELAARAFHRASGREGRPFIAVNCAAIPEGLAERLFFGARRGAYSGANEDVEGYLQSADGGTLFLDEIGELDPLVQPKLLRVLETREVLPLGASKPRKVDLRICAATLRDLRAHVASGRFREDLYYRLGRPEVRVPPLVERREEIPWLVARELQRVDASLAATAALVEVCVTRLWPGNVRELLIEVRQAAGVALAAGRTSVRAQDLSPGAGLAVMNQAPSLPAPAPSAPERPTLASITPEAAAEALRASSGNVTQAALRLGVHRTQLRRFIAKGGLGAPQATAEGDDEPKT